VAWNINRRSVLAAIAFAACLTASVAGVWALANASFSQGVPPPSEGLHLRLDVAGGGWSISFESNASRNNTAFSFLLEAARALHFSVVWQNWTVPPDSVFVHSIGGDVNGDSGRWWQYWIDGVYGSVGANHAALNDGDVLEWRFAQYPP
jgi:hypothetical protein